jgi:hypothetical protein
MLSWRCIQIGTRVRACVHLVSSALDRPELKCDDTIVIIPQYCSLSRSKEQWWEQWWELPCTRQYDYNGYSTSTPVGAKFRSRISSQFVFSCLRCWLSLSVCCICPSVRSRVVFVIASLALRLPDLRPITRPAFRHWWLAQCCSASGFSSSSRSLISAVGCCCPRQQLHSLAVVFHIKSLRLSVVQARVCTNVPLRRYGATTLLCLQGSG